MKAILKQIVEYQIELMKTVQSQTDHLNALANTLFLENRQLETKVKNQVALNKKVSDATGVQLQSNLEILRRAISQLPD